MKVRYLVLLYYNRTDISEGDDLAKINKYKECRTYHYWFFNHGFKFQDYVWNGCHDLMMLCPNISDINIITDKKVIMVLLFITLANLKQRIY